MRGNYSDSPSWPETDTDMTVGPHPITPLSDVPGAFNSEQLIWMGGDDELPPTSLWWAPDFTSGVPVWTMTFPMRARRISTGEVWEKIITVRLCDALEPDGTSKWGKLVTRETETIDVDPEMPPANLARTLYNQMQEHKHSGRVSFAGKSSWFFNGWTNYLSIRNASNSEVAQGPIQSIDIDAFTDVTNIQIGPASHLGFTDLMKLAQQR